jgi:hypothetical protein
MLTFRHIGIATLSGLFVTASVAVCQTVATGNSQRNTLSYYDPGMVKMIHAYGPLFSDDIPRASTESAAPNDFVEKIQVPDGSEVRVLVKVPAPAEPSKILRVPPDPPRNNGQRLLRQRYQRSDFRRLRGGHLPDRYL